MSNLRICGKNAVDDSRAVLTCSVTDILPVANLQNVARGRILRVAAGTGIEVRMNLGGEDFRATFMSAIRHNLESDATIRYLGYSDNLTTLVIDTDDRPAVPSATLSALDFGIEALGISLWDPTSRQKRTTIFFDDDDMLLNTSEILQSCKVIITNPTNTTGYIDISRLWTGKYLELTDNPVYGSTIGLIDESQTYRTDGGGPHTDAAVPYRGAKYETQFIPEADRAFWSALAEYCGAGRKPFFLSLLPDNTIPALTKDCDGEFIFKNPLPQFAFVDAADGRHSTSITIEET